jgi:hypothetical protein
MKKTIDYGRKIYYYVIPAYFRKNMPAGGAGENGARGCAPLKIKGKLVERQGRKAMGLKSLGLRQPVAEVFFNIR